MCDIFPPFDNFCNCINLKVGMLMIAMLSITTGCITMCVCEQRTDTTYRDMVNATAVRDTKNAISGIALLIRAGISAIALTFMVTGIVLLFATLTDEAGLVQIFVWGTFAAILFGFILVISIGYDCLSKQSCILDGMDWLSASTLMTFITAYLISWIYLISIANSFVLQVFTY